jgi:hypothetical protein
MSDAEQAIEGRIGAPLRARAQVPLGMTARLEMSVVRRDREEAGFSFQEKLCAVAVTLCAGLVGGGPVSLGVLLIAGVVALAYAQWTVLVEESAER